MTAYLATFGRIGRCNDVPPLPVEGDANEIARQVYGYAVEYLGTRDINVHIDPEALTGTIYAGWARDAGSFTLSDQPETPAAAAPDGAAGSPDERLPGGPAAAAGPEVLAQGSPGAQETEN